VKGPQPPLNFSMSRRLCFPRGVLRWRGEGRSRLGADLGGKVGNDVGNSSVAFLESCLNPLLRVTLKGSLSQFFVAAGTLPPLSVPSAPG